MILCKNTCFIKIATGLNTAIMYVKNIFLKFSGLARLCGLK